MTLILIWIITIATVTTAFCSIKMAYYPKIIDYGYSETGVEIMDNVAPDYTDLAKYEKFLKDTDGYGLIQYPEISKYDSDAVEYSEVESKEDLLDDSVEIITPLDEYKHEQRVKFGGRV